MEPETKFVQEVDTLSIVRAISRKNKKMQAILLQELEKNLAKGTPEYENFRKVILDESNNCVRATVRLLFGDIDFGIK